MPDDARSGETGRKAGAGAPDRNEQTLSVAVVGNREVVVAFRAAGLAVFPLEAGDDAAARVEEVIAEGYRVVFFTEELSPALAPVLERYRRAAVPCLVALPQGGSGESLARLRGLVRRAVGSDVFAGER
ncbi:MAG: V-type ATP synthase subunit F [bacterium]